MYMVSVKLRVCRQIEQLWGTLYNWLTASVSSYLLLFSPTLVSETIYAEIQIRLLASITAAWMQVRQSACLLCQDILGLSRIFHFCTLHLSKWSVGRLSPSLLLSFVSFCFMLLSSCDRFSSSLTWYSLLSQKATEAGRARRRVVSQHTCSKLRDAGTYMYVCMYVLLIC